MRIGIGIERAGAGNCFLQIREAIAIRIRIGAYPVRIVNPLPNIADSVPVQVNQLRECDSRV